MCCALQTYLSPFENCSKNQITLIKTQEMKNLLNTNPICNLQSQ